MKIVIAMLQTQIATNRGTAMNAPGAISPPVRWTKVGIVNGVSLPASKHS
jgi:hypothetical protein